MGGLKAFWARRRERRRQKALRRQEKRAPKREKRAARKQLKAQRRTLLRARRQEKRAARKLRRQARRMTRRERRQARWQRYRAWRVRRREARSVRRYRWRAWLTQLPFRRAFLVYVLIALVLSVAVSIAVMLTLAAWRDSMASSYYQMLVNDGVRQVYRYEMPSDTRMFIQLLEFAMLAMVPVCALVTISFVGRAFYRRKLMVPLEVLRDAARRISENDLDFHIVYDSRDEMGQLCQVFERMRDALLTTNREMWRAMEERKRLNGAFAHDLRTPLTVLKGYSDFLRQYVPQGKVSGQKLLSTLDTMSQHIERLEKYVTSMSEIQRLEDLTPRREALSMAALTALLTGALRPMGRETGVSVALECRAEPAAQLWVDSGLVVQVAENLVSNALGYAKAQVSVRLDRLDGQLRLSVTDDGRGFTEEELARATQAFFKDAAHQNTNHFGLGLNIVKTLCEKHGGILLLSNAPGGGACVQASFDSTPQVASSSR